MSGKLTNVCKHLDVVIDNAHDAAADAAASLEVAYKLDALVG